MLVRELVSRYALERELSAAYVVQLAVAVTLFDRFIGRPADLIDLVDDAFNRWLVWLSEGRRPYTVRSRRNHLLALWRFAFDAGLTDVQPCRIRKVRTPATLPEAWEAGQLLCLLRAADQQPGEIRRWHVPWSAYWRAFILAGYDSGLRLGDLLALRWDQITGDGCILLVQHKTNWPLLARLRPETMAALAAIKKPHRQRPFQCLGRQRLWRRWKALTTAAGLTGGPRKLRKSGASAIERENPGAATAYLGHKSPDLAVRFYIDPKIARRDRPQPPGLTG